ncbi:MAG TPA: hypothetical protein VMC81_10210 [Rhodocyclaceae bacterium]|nr:hypothetical protein [Rhodocyclaceae bacterium]
MEERVIYYVSARPEAYEFWGEVGHSEAREIGELIARCAAERFPNVEFRVDDAWHDHQPGTELVAAFIDAHWQEWLADAGIQSRAA